MPNFAIIENGVVENIVIADIAYANLQGWIEATPEVCIGFLFDDEKFTDPRPVNPTLEIVKPPAPTKEQLLTQLKALEVQIQSLE
jgi:hypothetical protein